MGTRGALGAGAPLFSLVLVVTWEPGVLWVLVCPYFLWAISSDVGTRGALGAGAPLFSLGLLVMWEPGGALGTGTTLFSFHNMQNQTDLLIFSTQLSLPLSPSNLSSVGA